jgi:hypothetical protein
MTLGDATAEEAEFWRRLNGTSNGFVVSAIGAAVGRPEALLKPSDAPARESDRIVRKRRRCQFFDGVWPETPSSSLDARERERKLCDFRALLLGNHPRPSLGH